MAVTGEQFPGFKENIDRSIYFMWEDAISRGKQIGQIYNEMLHRYSECKFI